MHDAIALANLLYAMPTATSNDLTRIFEDYRKERYPAVMESYKNSQVMGKRLDKGITGAIFLFLLTHMPMWLWRMMVCSYHFCLLRLVYVVSMRVMMHDKTNISFPFVCLLLTKSWQRQFDTDLKLGS